MLFPINWGAFFLICHITLVTGFIVRVLYYQQNIAVTLAWIIILLTFPFIGAIIYLLIGEPRLGKKRQSRTKEMAIFFDQFSQRHLTNLTQPIKDIVGPRYHGISKIATEKTGLIATADNSLNLLTTDQAIVDNMRRDIAAAQSTCLLEFYIIDAQGTIMALLEDVMLAAQRGVKCSILADAVGSANFWRSSWPQRLSAAGVLLTPSLPVGILKTFFIRADLRNHRKLLIVDQKVAYTGSFNLVDAGYFKRHAGVGQWIDVMLRCQGSMVKSMVAVFAVDMGVETKNNLVEVKTWLEQQGRYALSTTDQPISHQPANVISQVIPSAPSRSEHVIYSTIICALHSAVNRIIITTPYFVPDSALLLALTTAAERGVEVTLIVPEALDSTLVKYASRAYYPRLLKAGVKIALFKGGLLHSKTLTIDGDYALFGTVNMDMRSFYLNLEISLAIYNQDLCQQIVTLQNSYLQQCDYIKLSTWQARSKWLTLTENFVRLFSPLL